MFLPYGLCAPSDMSRRSCPCRYVSPSPQNELLLTGCLEGYLFAIRSVVLPSGAFTPPSGEPPPLGKLAAEFPLVDVSWRFSWKAFLIDREETAPGLTRPTNPCNLSKGVDSTSHLIHRTHTQGQPPSQNLQHSSSHHAHQGLVKYITAKILCTTHARKKAEKQKATNHTRTFGTNSSRRVCGPPAHQEARSRRRPGGRGIPRAQSRGVSQSYQEGACPVPIQGRRYPSAVPIRRRIPGRVRYPGTQY